MKLTASSCSALLLRDCSLPSAVETVIVFSAPSTWQKTSGYEMLCQIVLSFPFTITIGGVRSRPSWLGAVKSFPS